MLRHSRTDAVSARRLRIARLRRALVTVMTIAFATFISVANATAEDLGAAPEQQPTGEVVILVPAEEAAPAPVVEPAPAPEPAPVVEPAPAPVEAAPAPVEVAPVEPVVEETAKVDAPLEQSEADAPGEQVKTLAPVEAPKEQVAAAGPNSYNKVINVGGTWVVSHDVKICHANSGSAVYSFSLPNADADSVLGNGSDHGSHETSNFGPGQHTVGDIVESFYYVQGNPNPITNPSFYPGRNLDATANGVGLTWATVVGTAGIDGQTILDNNCAGPVVVNPPAPPTCTPPLVDFDPGVGLDCRPVKPTVTHKKVSICHATSGVGTGFYNVQSVADDAIFADGHGDLTPGAAQNHPADIIPSFTYTTDYTWDAVNGEWDEVTATFAGKNLGTFTRVVHFPQTGNVTWTIDGAAVGAKLAAGTATDADCSPADPPAKPDVPLVPVRLCHVNGFNSWAPVLVADARTIVAPGGHGTNNLAHFADVIPAFTYTTDFTYSVVTNSWTAVTASYAGKNLANTQGVFSNAMTGNARLATNGCAPGKPAVYHQVSVCHSGGNGAFALQTWAINNGDVTAGHGAHADDVIPPFLYVHDYQWQNGLGWVPQFKTFAGRNLGLFSQTVNAPGGGTVNRTFSGAGLLLSGCAVPAIPAKPKIQHVKVQICDQNQGVGSDFYNVTTVDDDAILPDGTGHSGHDYDIIPSFTYQTGFTYSSLTNSWVPQTATYAGKNLKTFTRDVHYPHTGTITWTIDGVAIGAKLAAGTAEDSDCGPAAPPVKPTIADQVVTVCHATTDLAGFDTYVPQAWTIVDGDVAAGHGLDANDIIPSFPYIVDYAYDVVTNSWNPVWAAPDFPGQNLGTFTRTMNLPVVGSVPWTINGAAALNSQSCAFTQPAPKPPVTATPVTLCHATNVLGLDSYVTFTGTSDDVIGAGTHGSDANDVIPAFTYTTGFSFDPVANAWNPITQTHPGQNLGSFTRSMSLPLIGTVTRTLDGTKMLGSSCQVPSLPLRPDLEPVRVTLCHAYVLDGRDYYSAVTTTHTSVLDPTSGHFLDANDVIPAFTFTTDYNYDHVTNSWIPQLASYAGQNLGTFTRTVNLATGPASVTFNGASMLETGTCPTPSIPTSADTTPAPTLDPLPDQTGGGDDPVEADADPVDPVVEGEADEPAEEPAAVEAEDEDALPFTGLELGALLLIGIGAIGAGTVLHGGRRRRRNAVAND